MSLYYHRIFYFTALLHAWGVAQYAVFFNFNIYKDIVMKKINLSEAENIIGGTFVCTKDFEWVGSGSSKTCNLVTTCADKFGGVKKTYRPAPTASCPATPTTPN